LIWQTFSIKFDHYHQAVNYFQIIEEAEWFWPQKVAASLFECIQKAKGDEKVESFCPLKSKS
jgi:hypothetical protein